MKTRLARIVRSLVLPAVAPAADEETLRPGAVLKTAMIGEPPALDLHWTTAIPTQQITWHVYDTLSR